LENGGRKSAQTVRRVRLLKMVARVGEVNFNVELEGTPNGQYKVNLDGKSFLVDARRVGTSAILSLLIEGRSYETHVDGARNKFHVALVGSAFDVILEDELSSRVSSKGAGAAEDEGRAVVAPMPGLVVQIKVSPGDRVESGQAVAIVEAMKMQNELSAPAPGVVAEVHVKSGDAVATGQTLLTMTPL
jgi:pyruvate carboxylase subunit B